MNINVDTTSDSDNFIVESETSAGDQSGTKTDDTIDIIENLKKTEQFDEIPSIQTISS